MEGYAGVRHRTVFLCYGQIPPSCANKDVLRRGRAICHPSKVTNTQKNDEVAYSPSHHFSASPVGEPSAPSVALSYASSQGKLIRHQRRQNGLYHRPCMSLQKQWQQELRMHVTSRTCLVHQKNKCRRRVPVWVRPKPLHASHTLKKPILYNGGQHLELYYHAV